MANLKAVLQDQEPWRLVDEDTDQHSHPLFRRSPGMKMLGARGREGIKRYRRRNERFLRNEIQYFQEIIQTTFQKVETYTNRPTEPTDRRETECRRQTKRPGPRTRHQVGSSDTSRRAGPGQPRSCTATHRPGRRARGTKGPKSRSRSLARMSASATLTPNYQVTASSSQRRHGATARVHLDQGTQNRPFRDREPAPPCPGIRSQRETEIDDPTFTLQPVAI